MGRKLDLAWSRDKGAELLTLKTQQDCDTPSLLVHM